MSTFNELYQSIYGDNGVKGQSQKRDHLIQYYQNLYDINLCKKQAEWDDKFKILSQDDKYKSMLQSDTEAHDELCRLEAEVERAENKWYKLSCDLNNYVEKEIGSRPLNSKFTVGKELTANLKMVSELYKLDRQTE